MSIEKIRSNKYIIAVIVGLLFITAIISALRISSSKSTKEIVQQKMGYNAEKLYEYKTKYIGDASKVGNLTSNLPFAQYKSGISLQTDKQPYEATVDYRIKQGQLSNINAQLAKNAAVIFSLVENAEGVIFNIDDGIKQYKYHFTREYADFVINLDMKEYSSTLEKFRDELLPTITNRNWTDATLYVWRDKRSKETCYTLLAGTNDIGNTQDIYSSKSVTKDLNEINLKLGWYVCGNLLTIRHDSSFTKDEMTKISDNVHFPGTSKCIGVFGDLLDQQENNDISSKVEKNLASIMSSPMSSSNPADYIKVHQKEYEDILKMGDSALNYMLSCFKENNTQGLKGYIMMELCKEILGDRNNVRDGDYKSPEEWYSKLAPYTAKELPKFKYSGSDNLEQLVYSAALQQYDRNNGDSTLTVVAPHIFGTYEHKNELRIFVTVYYSRYKLYENTLSEGSAGIVPAAIIYTKNSDGKYTFKEYVEAQNGSYFQSSIKKFCEPKNDIADSIMNHYGNYSDLFEIMKKNIKQYLNENGFTGINIKRSNGDIIPAS